MKQGVRMASKFFNGNATRVIIAVMLLLMSVGIAHVFAKIDDNADAIKNQGIELRNQIKKNATNIDSLSVKLERFMATVNTTSEFNKNALVEIKEELKSIKVIVDEIRFNRRP